MVTADFSKTTLKLICLAENCVKEKQK